MSGSRSPHYWLADVNGTISPQGSARQVQNGKINSSTTVVTYLAVLPDWGLLAVHQDGSLDWSKTGARQCAGSSTPRQATP